MPEDLDPGLREQLLTIEVERLVERATAAALHAEVSDLTDAEAADRLSRYLGDFVKRAIESVPEREQAAFGVRLTRQLLEELSRRRDGALTPDELPIEPGRVLRALLRSLPGGGVETIERPLTPLLDTTVFTNARGEPSVRHELQAEIASAESIDIVIAFIRYSGIAPLLDALRRHCQTGKSIRVLTTTYTNSTEARALEALVELGADVRVSYDVSSTRLHAKAWIFHRGNAYSTAYVGSSNLTHMAQVTGLEWNVRLSGARNPDAVAKVAAVCESYWHSGDFVPYDAEVFLRQTAVADENGTFELPVFDIEPRPFQRRLLELLAVSRKNGHTKNLLVAATGTGKTVMSALDYANLRSSLDRSRLLFVAHRDEILRQSRATFGTVLRDMSFGEMWVGGSRPQEFEHVFASIQSLAAARPESIRPTSTS
jgi:HKD family nuclease